MLQAMQHLKGTFAKHHDTGEPLLKRPSFLPSLRHRPVANTIPSPENSPELGRIAMGEASDDDSGPMNYSHLGALTRVSRARYHDLNGDEILGWTVNQPISNPLYGPSSNRADGIETRAMNMITGSAVGRCCENTGHSSRKGLNWLLSRSSCCFNRRKGYKKNDLETRGLIHTSSEESLVHITVEDSPRLVVGLPGLQDGTNHRQAQHLAWPEPPRLSYRKDMDLLAELKDALGSELPSSPLTRQLLVPYPTPVQHHTTITNNKQSRGILRTGLVVDDEISVLELSLKQCEPTADGEHPLDSKIPIPGSHSDKKHLPIAENASTPTQDSSGSPFLGPSCQRFGRAREYSDTPSPPASLLIESPPTSATGPQHASNPSPHSFMVEQVGSPAVCSRRFDRTQALPRASPQAFAPPHLQKISEAQQERNLTPRDYCIPTIYPGMEQCPSPLDSEDEDWSNTSHSIFGSTPPCYHRVVVPASIRF